MRYEIVDRRFHFISGFDTDTGAYIRTGILDAQGRDTGHDPFMASFPHLIDVGVMGTASMAKPGYVPKLALAATRVECW